MQHFGIRELSKTILTITGILLLIIFGMRAASQASSLAAVGGETKKSLAPFGTNFASVRSPSALQSSTGLNYSYFASPQPENAAVATDTSNSNSNNLIVRAAANAKNEINGAIATVSQQTYNTSNTLNIQSVYGNTMLKSDHSNNPDVK